MMRSCFSEEHIIGMIKEQESGILTAEVCQNSQDVYSTLQSGRANEKPYSSKDWSV